MWLGLCIGLTVMALAFAVIVYCILNWDKLAEEAVMRAGNEAEAEKQKLYDHIKGENIQEKITYPNPLFIYRAL